MGTMKTMKRGDTEMTVSILGTLSCYMLISSFTPGPGNLLAMNTTTRFGWRKGKNLIFGICCGYLLVQIICTLALYSLNMVLSPVLSVLKYAGALYMVWLAVHIAVSRPETACSQKAPSFSVGFLLQLVNVKIYFYISTLLTAYLIPHIDSLPVLLLAGVGVTAIGSAASLTWAFLGVKLQAVYKKQFRIINGILALFLLYCAWGIVRG